MKWTERPGALLFGLCFVAQVYAFHALPHDDAYIAYRYGRNLALGRGLVFNPGEHVLGFTSPLHVLLASVAHLLAGRAALPHVMAALGCAGWSAQALAVSRLFERATGRRFALLLGVLVAVGGANSELWVALETNLAVALSLWALSAALDENWTLGAVLAGFACLARPDAALMALLLAGLALARVRQGRLRTTTAAPAMLGFALVVVPWVAFAALYYGSPLPEPLLVKFQRTTLPEYAEHILHHATETLLGVAEPEAELVLVAWLAAVAGALGLVSRDRRLALLFAYGALEFAAYLVLRPFRQHAWHLYPAVLVFCLAAWGLVIEALRWCARRIHGAAVVLVGAALVLVYAVRTVEFARAYPTAYWFGARDTVYRRAASYLEVALRPNERVAAVEVGTLGYYSDARFYDLGGLITKAPVVALKPPRPYGWLAADGNYPYLAFPERTPVRIFADSGFELRLYSDR